MAALLIKRLFATLCRVTLAVVSSSELARAAEEGNTFDVFELRVLGNSVLPLRDVERILYPHLGENKTLADVETARKSLEDHYHERGFGTVYVDIPEQTVNDGLVRLRVTEATVRRVAVSGARYFSGRQILASLPEATPGNTPSLPALQTQLAVVNSRSRDRSVVPVLRAGAAPGTVDLTLQVNDSLPAHASLEVNNQNTAQTEPLRVIAGISYDNLFGRFDSIGVQYQTAPEATDQVSVWLLNYGTTLADERTRLAFYYFTSDSDIATLGTADATVSVLGKGSVAGGRWIRPLGGGNNSLHTLTAGLDYKDFLQNIALTPLDPGAAPGAGGSGLATPVSYLNFSLGYSGGWRFGEHQLTFGASGNFGVRGWQNEPLEFELKRFRASPNYFHVRSDGRLRLALPAGFSTQLSYAGQFTVDPIISNEQFSIAGANGVRGYLESEELGDRGIRTSFELGLPTWRLASDVFSLGSFAFYDYGTFSLVQPLPSDRASADLQSWGVGLDLSAFGRLSSTVTWTYPLKDSSQTLKGDGQVLFLVRGVW